MPTLFSGKHILEDFSRERLLLFGAQLAAELKRIIEDYKPKILEVELKFTIHEEDFVNAAENRNFERDNQQQHQDGNGPRQAAETSNRNRLVEGRKE